MDNQGELAVSGLRALCRAAEPLIGHFVVEFATPGTPYLIAGAGARFVVLDLEHSGFSFETAKSFIAAARSVDLPVVLRAPSREPQDITRALDVGADGVMLPSVPDVASARAILHAARYVPEGMRGVSQRLMHDRYAAGSFAEKAKAANARTAVILQIETVGGVEAAEEIAAVDGVDGLWLGHMDLSCSLGAPAAFDDPRFLAAERRVVAAARDRGIGMGRMARDAKEARSLLARDYTIVACGNDVQAYSAGLAAFVSATNEGARA